MTLPPSESYREIPVGHGMFALVDAQDYDWLSRWNWHTRKYRNGATYAIRNALLGQGEEMRYVAMHREIMQPPEGATVDHVNQNGLDNRRGNLRLCDKAQNGWNRGATKRSTTKVKGVHFLKRTGRYQAQIMIRGKRTHIGYYATLEEAKDAYEKFAKEAQGEFCSST